MFCAWGLWVSLYVDFTKVFASRDGGFVELLFVLSCVFGLQIGEMFGFTLVFAT